MGYSGSGGMSAGQNVTMRRRPASWRVTVGLFALVAMAAAAAAADLDGEPPVDSQETGTGQEGPADTGSHEQAPYSHSQHPSFRHDGDYVYWNEITGEMQDTDPGGVPFEDRDGHRYWLEGARLVGDDPQAMQYVWVEMYNQAEGREFFLNQETQQSTWGRPVDLAWRLVKRPTDKYADL